MVICVWGIYRNGQRIFSEKIVRDKSLTKSEKDEKDEITWMDCDDAMYSIYMELRKR